MCYSKRMNNRELKFRAWNPTSEAMFWSNRMGLWKFFNYTESIEQFGVELMQYTGLKDKNDKESYHKDILRYITGLLCTIEYGEYQSRNGTGFGWHLRKIGGEVYIPFPYDLEYWEVIGNIYENKELLK